MKIAAGFLLALAAALPATAQIADDADNPQATPWIRPDHCPPDPPASERAAHAIGWLLFPRFDVRVPVFEGVDLETLKVGAGHVTGTARLSHPGRYGNCVIAAHRTSFFGPLESFVEGDRIVAITAEGVQDFEVARIALVDPSRVEAAGKSESPRLTLVTCYPFNYLGSAPARLIVEARPLTEPPGTPDPPEREKRRPRGRRPVRRRS